MVLQATLVITTIGCTTSAPPRQRLVDTSHPPVLAHARVEVDAQVPPEARDHAQDLSHQGPARDAFLKAEALFDELALIQPTGSGQELLNAHQRRRTLFDAALKQYAAIFQLKDDYWTCAALVRVGQLLEAQADAIETITPPPAMTLTQARQLKADLSQRSQSFRQEAAKMYHYAAAIGQKHPESSWARLALDAYERLHPFASSP